MATTCLAARAEQIRVAEKVLRSQGIGAWGQCGRRGLTGPVYHTHRSRDAEHGTDSSVRHVGRWFDE